MICFFIGYLVEQIYGKHKAILQDAKKLINNFIYLLNILAIRF